jgi:hypothetical protein
LQKDSCGAIGYGVSGWLRRSIPADVQYYPSTELLLQQKFEAFSIELATNSGSGVDPGPVKVHTTRRLRSAIHLPKMIA